MHTNKIKYLNSILAQFGQELNSAGLLWGVGTSTLLYYYGLVDCPNDIDIIIAEKDIEKADRILSAYGNKQVRDKSSIYATEHFIEYNLPEIDIDAMSGYKIILPDGIYCYLFDKLSTPLKFNINNVDIPFMTLEDWYVLYQIMPDRENKVRIIEDYLRKNGIKYPHLMKRMIHQKFTPKSVIERTTALLNHK